MTIDDALNHLEKVNQPRLDQAISEADTEAALQEKLPD